MKNRRKLVLSGDFKEINNDNLIYYLLLHLELGILILFEVFVANNIFLDFIAVKFVQLDQFGQACINIHIL